MTIQNILWKCKNCQAIFSETECFVRQTKRPEGRSAFVSCPFCFCEDYNGAKQEKNIWNGHSYPQGVVDADSIFYPPAAGETSSCPIEDLINLHDRPKKSK